jgi:hypothetical protein
VSVASASSSIAGSHHQEFVLHCGMTLLAAKRVRSFADSGANAF